MTQRCSNCGKEPVQVRTDRSQVVSVGRRKSTVENLVYSLCSECEQEFTTSTQHDSNVLRVQAALAQLTSITPLEIRRIRGTLGLSQDEARLLFGGGKTAFSKYERGRSTPSESMARLMQLSTAVPGVIQYLAKVKNIPSRPQWQALEPKTRTKTQVVYVNRISQVSHIRSEPTEDFLEVIGRLGGGAKVVDLGMAEAFTQDNFGRFDGIVAASRHVSEAGQGTYRDVGIEEGLTRDWLEQ